MLVGDPRRDYANEKFEPLALVVGRIILAWNSLHTELFSIFAAISGYSNQLIPGSIWYALTSDKAQRDVIKKLTKLNAIGFQIPKDLKREINWIVDQTNSLENIRNHFTHTTFGIANGNPFALHLGQHDRGLSFNGKDIMAEADWLFKSISKLSAYSTQVSIFVQRPNEPLPQRPLLPNRPDPS